MVIYKRENAEKFNYSEDKKLVSKRTEKICQFLYDTEDEREKHKAEMLEQGFKDSGQVKENMGSVFKPQYEWFASYYKVEVSNYDEDGEEVQKFLK